MPSCRMPVKAFFTFVAFNSCARQTFGYQSRSLSFYRPKCLPPKSVHDKCQLHTTSPRLAAAKNPYEILGVKPDASSAEIKKTYFALARKYHPDTNSDKGARDKFVEIQDAYDILKDGKKRAAYDQYGSASQTPGFDPNAFAGAGGFGGFGKGAGGFSNWSFTSDGASAGSSPGDLFEQLFGAFGGGTGRGTQGSLRGDDLEATVTVNFLDACKGTKKKISITPIVDCSTCSASGLKPGVKQSTCSSCRGSGTRTFALDNGFQMASTCNACGGEGKTIPKGGECLDCRGVGKVRINEQVTVNIPVGAEEGMTIRIPRYGDAPVSSKGPRGDLLVRLNVTPSSIFKRQGGNLHYQARIPFHRALLGGIVRVPTLEGEVDVRVPGGTQQGEEMVLKGRGVSFLHGGGSGDLFVKFNLQLPRNLTARQRSLLEQYADDVEKRSSPQKDAKDAKDAKEPHSADNDDQNSTFEKKDEVKRATG